MDRHIEKVTMLDKIGPDSKKVRKAEELYYLMKQIKE